MQLRPIRGTWYGDLGAVAMTIGLLVLILPSDPGHADDLSQQLTSHFGMQPGSTAARLALPGLLLIIGLFAGRVAAAAGLPQLTGHLLTGICLGPLPQLWDGGEGLIHSAYASDLGLVSNLAIGLIALLAGCEIRFSWLVARWRAVAITTGALSLVVPTVVTLLILFFGQQFAPLSEAIAAGAPLWLLGALLGCIALASSPMVVVTLIKEHKATGALPEIAMGVAVLKDIVVVLAFTLCLALLAAQQAGGGASMSALIGGAAGKTLAKIVMSCAVGALLGYALRLYTERTGHRLGWLLIGLSLLVAVLADSVNGWIKPLFCLIAAGVVCENVPGRTHEGEHRLEAALAQVAAPVFIIFFVATGLKMQLGPLRDAWIAVLALVFVRFAAVYISCFAAGKILRESKMIGQRLLPGMLPQAGITIGLLAIVRDQLPPWAGSMADWCLGALFINLLVAPVWFSSQLAADKASK